MSGPISFHQEFQRIKAKLKFHAIQFNYLYELANRNNFERALQKNPLGLHFSGHGFQNKEATFEPGPNNLENAKLFAQNSKKGDILLLENENGDSEFFYAEEIR